MIWTDITKNLTGDTPSARSRHGMASLNGYIYVFGGSCAEGEVMHAMQGIRKQPYLEQCRPTTLLNAALEYPNGRRSLMSTRIKSD